VFKDHDRFSKLWAGAQSFVVSVAVLAGGGWTLYTFISLNLIGKAKADLEKSRIETRDLLRRQPVLSMAITSVQETLGSGGYDLAITVLIENKGSLNTQITWTKATPLVIASFRQGEQGHLVPGTVTVAKPLALVETSPSSYLILAGGLLRLPFLVHLTHAGLYYLQFQTEVSLTDVTDVEKLGTPSGHPLVWSDSSFVVVRP